MKPITYNAVVKLLKEKKFDFKPKTKTLPLRFTFQGWEYKLKIESQDTGRGVIKTIIVNSYFDREIIYHNEYETFEEFKSFIELLAMVTTSMVIEKEKQN